MPAHCWFRPDALTELYAEAHRWRTRETGGALLGWRDGDATVVARILGPGPQARHGVRWFEPDVKWQNEQGSRIYRASGRTVAYLGDWHTHPLGAPRPSRQDAETAKLIAEDTAFRAAIPLYAILGRSLGSLASGSPWRLAVFEWRDDDFAAVTVHYMT